MSAFRTASSSLIFLVTLLCSVRMACPGSGVHAVYPENENRRPIWTAQLLQEISEQEYRTGQFIKAARNGEAEKVRKFLAEGMDVNSKNRNEDTALIEACGTGQKKVVELLLAKGADVRARNKSRLTAADKAVMNNHYEVTVLLLKTGKVELKEVLLPALRYGNVRIAREIVQGKAETPLHGSWLVVACQSGNIELVRLVLEKGADPNYENGQPLLEASFDAPLEVIQLLLDKGAKVDLRAPNSTNYTALAMACLRSRSDVAKLLVERGANINVKVEKRGLTPLMLAVGNAKTEAGYKLVKFLVNPKTDLNMKNSVGQTALHLASSNGLPDVVRLLLDNRADLEAKDQSGLTPLMRAVQSGQVAVVQLLLERGANPNVKTEKGWTAMRIAEKLGHKDVQTILKKHGAKQ